MTARPPESNTKRLMVAMMFSLVILLGFELLSPMFLPPVPSVEKQAVQHAAKEEVQKEVALAVTQPTIAYAPIKLENSRVQATYNPAGGRIESWLLRNYAVAHTDAPGYPHLHAQADRGETHQEYVESGWQGSGIEAPGAKAIWSVAQTTSNSVVMTWANQTGQTFTRTVTLRPDSYVMQIDDAVANSAGLPVNLTPYAQVHRADGEFSGEMSSFVNHLGPMGVVKVGDDLLLKEEGFSALRKGRVESTTASGGWWGFTSHYFMTALVPVGDTPTVRGFRHSTVNNRDMYTASVQGETVVVPPGGQANRTTLVYAGPKRESDLLGVGYSLERAIDWGWFRAIARPFYWALLWFYEHTGNWGIAIFLLTLALKIITFPLANKSYHAMAKMKKLQPEMEKLKERYKDDQQGMATAMMKMYRDHKVNPLSGCWPMLIQIPIFFAMYKVILLAFEFRHAPLGLWIQDLSLMDPFYVLPLLMGASMWVQMRLNPPPADPAQALVFKWMPVLFTVMFLWFPAGLVLYWLINNVLSIAQQAYIMRQEKVL